MFSRSPSISMVSSFARTTSVFAAAATERSKFRSPPAIPRAIPLLRSTRATPIAPSICIASFRATSMSGISGFLPCRIAPVDISLHRHLVPSASRVTDHGRIASHTMSDLDGRGPGNLTMRSSDLKIFATPKMRRMRNAGRGPGVGRCERLEGSAVSVPLYQAKAEMFRTLGHPVRIRVLELLQDGPKPVRDLLAEIDVEASNLSQQLAVLRRTGMVTSFRDGALVMYALSTPDVADLLAAGRR